MIRPLMALLTLSVLLPAGADAQRRGRAQQADVGRWAPVVAGVHGGYDDTSQANLLGAHLRIPVVRNGSLELVPGGNVTFAAGLKEYQLNVDAAYTLGGQNAGLYVAAGLAVRNTVFLGTEAETKAGVGVAGGIRAGGPSSPVGLQVELRQIYVDPDLRPRVLTIGLNIPIWGRHPTR